MIPEAAGARGAAEILSDSKISLPHTCLIHWAKQGQVCAQGFEWLKREGLGGKIVTALGTCFLKFINL